MSQNHFTCRGELICGASQIPLFYEQRDFSPAWCTDDGVLPQTRSLIEEITGAYADGLRPDDYHLAGIVNLLREVEKRQAMEEVMDPEILVDLDLLLTDAFMLYSSHLLAGRVNPETMHTDWIVEVPANDLIGTLQSALASNQVKETLRGLRPHNPGYLGLRKYLAQYRRLAESPSRPSPLTGKILRKGDRTASVQPLRERLTALGDLVRSDQEQEDLFDEKLEQAVFRFQKRHGLKQDGIVGPRTIDLALYLLQDAPRWTRDALLETIQSGKRKVVKLGEPIPVHLQYWTALVDGQGLLYFQDDIYDRDRPLDRALKERLPAG